VAQKTLPTGVTVAATGRATATLTNYGPYTYSVQQVGIEMPNAGGSAIGVIRKGGAIITPFAPVLDAPAGEPFINLYPNESMTVEWSGATVGATGTATFIFDDGTPA
jgi:hypothetical protein